MLDKLWLFSGFLFILALVIFSYNVWFGENNSSNSSNELKCSLSHNKMYILCDDVNGKKLVLTDFKVVYEK